MNIVNFDKEPFFFFKVMSTKGCVSDDTKSVASDNSITTEADSEVHRVGFLSRFFYSNVEVPESCENEILDTDKILGGNLRDEKRKRGTKGTIY